MKKILLGFLLTIGSASAQAPANSWFDASISGVAPSVIATDMSQNVYSSSGVLLTKYSSTGAQQWRRTTRMATGFALAPSGATCYMAGTVDYIGVAFDNGVSLPGTAVGTLTGYLMSFNAQGVAQWIRPLPTLPAPPATATFNFAVAVDEPRGQVYSAGNFANNYVLHQTTTAGVAGWAVQATGSGVLIGRAVAVDPSTGDVYVTGSVRGNIQLGAYSLTSSATGNDGFVARITALGAVAWAHRIGGAAGDDVATHLLTDATGNAYVAGYFTTSGTFGPAATGPLVSTGGTQNTFVASYSAQGALRWAQRAGGGSLVAVKGFNYEGAGPLLLSVAPLSRTYTYGATTVLNAPVGQDQTLLVMKLDTQTGGLLPAVQQQPLNLTNSLTIPDQFPLCVLASASSPAVYLGAIYQGEHYFSGLRLPRLIDMGYASAFIRLGAMAGAVATATKTEASQASLSIYPVPASSGSGFTVQCSTGATELRLLNSLGQKVHVQSALGNASEYSVPTADLVPGRYTLQVIGSEGVSTRAIVIE